MEYKRKLDALLVILLIAIVILMFFLIIKFNTEGSTRFRDPMKYAMRTSFISTSIGGKVNDVFCTCTASQGGTGIVITYDREKDELKIGEFFKNDSIIPNITLNLPY